MWKLVPKRRAEYNVGVEMKKEWKGHVEIMTNPRILTAHTTDLLMKCRGLLLSRCRLYTYRLDL